MKPELYAIWKKFLTWFGDLYYATDPPLCTAKQIREMLSVIEEGDVICRGYDSYIDSYFIPGEYTHSGIVCSKNEMIHAVAEGVSKIDPMDFVKDTDRFIILRPKYDLSVFNRDRAIALAIDKAVELWEKKVEYDFTFKEEAALYCHEFITTGCFLAAGLYTSMTHEHFGVWPFRFSRDLYLAQNIIDVCNVIYEFNPED